MYEINIFNVKEVNLEEEIFIVFYDDIIKNEVGLGLNLMDEILFEGGCFSWNLLGLLVILENVCVF